MKILFHVNRSACYNFHRIFQPIKHCRVHVSGEKEFYLDNDLYDGFDAYLFHGLISPNNLRKIEKISKFADIYWFMDDDLFHIPKWNPNSDSVNYTERYVMRECLKLSKGIVTTTEYLKNNLGFSEKTHVLPNYLDLAEYPEFKPREKRDLIGWVGGFTHYADLELLSDWVINSKHKFLFFGALPEKITSYSVKPGRHITQVKPKKSLGPKRVAFVRAVDFSVYPATFKNLNIDVGLCPLTDHVFNKSKCFDIGTRLLTNKGFLTANSINILDKVWHGKKWHNILAKEISNERPGYLLELEDGYKLKLSPEHRMLVGDKWEIVENIKIGDSIAMECETISSNLKNISIPWPADSRLSRVKGRDDNDWNSQSFAKLNEGPKLEITPRWGRILGAFIGDGSCQSRTAICISCDGQDQDWIDLLMDDFKAIGFNPRTDLVKTFNGKILRRRNVRVSSAHLLRVLESIGLVKMRKNGFPIRIPCVPEIIWKSPRKVIAQFISGYFESDGCVSKKHGTVSCVSKKELLLQDIQRLLLGFGIQSKLSNRIYKCTYKGQIKEGIYTNLLFRRKNRDIFAKNIGFQSIRKKTLLARATKMKTSNSCHNINWNKKVLKIEKCLIKPVDLQVEGSVFSLAGFVSHNSHLKYLEYSAMGIPVLASPIEPYLNCIEDGVDGVLIKNNDWQGGFERITEDMGQKAYEKVKNNYSWDIGREKWVQFFQQI